MCVEVFEPDKEKQLATMLKECGILAKNIMAFGDDLVDIGMLKLCGKGVAWVMRLKQ